MHAYAKINWSLAVVGRRRDGYHLLDSLMQTITLADTISVAPAKADALLLSVDGIAPTEQPEENLVLRAARLLAEHAGIHTGAHIRLSKQIPVGAGLGGGSADAAATLRALNRHWRLNLDAKTLATLGIRLGADVPFCLSGGLARAQGVGEVLRQVSPPAAVSLVVTQPGMGLSTPAVFRAYDALPTPPENPDIDRVETALRARDVTALASAMGNALEPVAISLHAPIGDCIRHMEANGALRAMMTGSGSAVIGLCASPTDARLLAASCRAVWPKTWAVETV